MGFIENGEKRSMVIILWTKEAKRWWWNAVKVVGRRW
jgi:hypothetical protein